MVNIIKTCHKGHAIVKGHNVEYCSIGSHCYHKILRGRSAHEYKNLDGLEDYCPKCMASPNFENNFLLWRKN